MKQAKSFYDWDYLAIMGYQLAPNKGSFKKCMERAESLAVTPEDWITCANTWGYCSKEEAMRCSKQADELDMSREVKS